MDDARTRRKRLWQQRHRLVPILLMTALVVACGPKLPPARFVDSATFRHMAGRVHGILERDLDHDGHQDAVVATRGEQGYSIDVLRQGHDEKGAQWSPVCTSEGLMGDDLDAMRWVNFGSKAVVFVLVLTENPEEVVQSFALIDVGDHCRTIASELVKLERGEVEDRLVPADFRSGAVLADDAASLTIVDEPQYLHLAGASSDRSNDLRVLTSVRRRQVSWPNEQLAITMTRLAVLTPANLTLQRDRPADTAAPVGEGQLHELHAVAGDDFRIHLHADRPMTLLELHHGCSLSAPSLTLTLANERTTFTTGAAPAPDSFVRASGTSHPTPDDYRDLVALRQPVDDLGLVIGPVDAERCLRAVKAFAFVTAVISASKP